MVVTPLKLQVESALNTPSDTKTHVRKSINQFLACVMKLTWPADRIKPCPGWRWCHSDGWWAGHNWASSVFSIQDFFWITGSLEMMMCHIYSHLGWWRFGKKVSPRRFYLKGDMTNFYPFIQGWLEWPFSELFSANVSVWNQCKYIAFNIFSCRFLIISFKILIVTGISNEKQIN